MQTSRGKKMSPKQNYYWTWILHLTLDPFLVMLCLGALGHIGNWEILRSLSYKEVWLATATAQFFWPFDVQAKIIPSKKKVEL